MKSGDKNIIECYVAWSVRKNFIFQQLHKK